MEILVFLIFWGFCGLVASAIYESRGHSGCSGLALGFFLGPLGILIAAVTPPTQQVVQSQQRGLDLERLEKGELRKCPYCAELVKQEAVVCRYCGKDLPPSKSTEPPVEVDLFSEGADRYSQRYLRITSQRIVYKNSWYPLEDITSATVEQTGSKFFVKVVTKDGREREFGHSSNKHSAIKIADIIHRARAEVIGQAKQPEQATTGDIEMPTPQWLIELASSSQPASSHNAGVRLDETIAKRSLLRRMTRGQWVVITLLAIGVVIVFFSIFYILVIARVSAQTTLPSQVNVSAPESATATLIPTVATPAPAVPPCTSTIERITLPTKQSTWGEMSPTCTKAFVVNLKAGQALALSYFGYGTQVSMMTVCDSNGKIVEGEGAAGTHFYTATSTGDYFITFRGTGTLICDIWLAAPSNTEATISRTPAAKRISFARGATSATVQGTTGAVDADHWVIAVLGGQAMSINLIVPNRKSGTLAVFGADSTVLLSNRAGVMQWSGLLPKTQDYFIDVKPGTGAMSYTLQVTIPPLK